MKNIIIGRLGQLFIKMTSLAFITWVMIYITYWTNKQPIDLNFLMFTCGVIGLKIWKGKSELLSKTE